MKVLSRSSDHGHSLHDSVNIETSYPGAMSVVAASSSPIVFKPASFSISESLVNAAEAAQASVEPGSSSLHGSFRASSMDSASMATGFAGMTGSSSSVAPSSISSSNSTSSNHTSPLALNLACLPRTPITPPGPTAAPLKASVIKPIASVRAFKPRALAAHPRSFPSTFSQRASISPPSATAASISSSASSNSTLTPSPPNSFSPSLAPARAQNNSASLVPSTPLVSYCSAPDAYGSSLRRAPPSSPCLTPFSPGLSPSFPAHSHGQHFVHSSPLLLLQSAAAAAEAQAQGFRAPSSFSASTPSSTSMFVQFPQPLSFNHSLPPFAPSHLIRCNSSLNAVYYTPQLFSGQAFPSSTSSHNATVPSSSSAFTSASRHAHSSKGAPQYRTVSALHGSPALGFMMAPSSSLASSCPTVAAPLSSAFKSVASFAGAIQDSSPSSSTSSSLLNATSSVATSYATYWSSKTPTIAPSSPHFTHSPSSPSSLAGMSDLVLPAPAVLSSSQSHTGVISQRLPPRARHFSATTSLSKAPLSSSLFTPALRSSLFSSPELPSPKRMRKASSTPVAEEWDAGSLSSSSSSSRSSSRFTASSATSSSASTAPTFSPGTVEIARKKPPSRAVQHLRTFVCLYIREHAAELINKDLATISSTLKEAYENEFNTGTKNDEKEPGEVKVEADATSSECNTGKKNDDEEEPGEVKVEAEATSSKDLKTSAKKKRGLSSPPSEAVFKRPLKMCRSFVQRMARSMGFVITKHYGLTHPSLKRMTKSRKRASNGKEGEIEKLSKEEEEKRKKDLAEQVKHIEAIMAAQPLPLEAHSKSFSSSSLSSFASSASASVKVALRSSRKDDSDESSGTSFQSDDDDEEDQEEDDYDEEEEEEAEEERKHRARLSRSRQTSLPRRQRSSRHPFEGFNMGQSD